MARRHGARKPASGPNVCGRISQPYSAKVAKSISTNLTVVNQIRTKPGKIGLTLATVTPGPRSWLRWIVR
jgi:hypothetical protein